MLDEQWFEFPDMWMNARFSSLIAAVLGVHVTQRRSKGMDRIYRFQVGDQTIQKKTGPKAADGTLYKSLIESMLNLIDAKLE